MTRRRRRSSEIGDRLADLPAQALGELVGFVVVFAGERASLRANQCAEMGRALYAASDGLSPSPACEAFPSPARGRGRVRASGFNASSAARFPHPRLGAASPATRERRKQSASTALPHARVRVAIGTPRARAESRAGDAARLGVTSALVAHEIAKRLRDRQQLLAAPMHDVPAAHDRQSGDRRHFAPARARARARSCSTKETRRQVPRAPPA